jgi:hypothetical protein
MTRYPRRNFKVSQRMIEQRERENAAPRLTEEVPRLRELRIEVGAHRDGALIPESVYIRRVVVTNAPALLWLPCSEPRCEEGGHDITEALVSGLRQGEVRITGESSCSGRVAGVACVRVIHFTAVADYD